MDFHNLSEWQKQHAVSASTPATPAGCRYAFLTRADAASLFSMQRVQVPFREIIAAIIRVKFQWCSHWKEPFYIMSDQQIHFGFARNAAREVSPVTAGISHDFCILAARPMSGWPVLNFRVRRITVKSASLFPADPMDWGWTSRQLCLRFVQSADC